jgi:hypothetical protein
VELSNRRCRHKMVNRAFCVALTTLFSVSCEREKLIVERCEAPSLDRLLVVGVGGPHTGGQGVGELAPREYTLGTILELVSTGSNNEPWTLRKTLALELKGPNLVHEVGPQELSLLSKLEIHVDADVEQVANTLGIRLRELIYNGTRVFVWNPIVESRDDLGALVNADDNFVHMIRDRQKNTFVIISGVMYGTSLVPVVDGEPFGSSGENIIKIDSMHVHVSIDCKRIAAFRPNLYTADRGRVPLLVKYSALRYDRPSGRIAIDEGGFGSADYFTSGPK